MRIKFIDTKEEYRISGIEKGSNGKGVIANTVVDGRYVARHGALCEGVEDITEYDAEGNEVIYYPIAFEEEAPA